MTQTIEKLNNTVYAAAQIQAELEERKRWREKMQAHLDEVERRRGSSQ